MPNSAYRRLRLEIFYNGIIVIGARAFGWSGNIDVLLSVESQCQGRVTVVRRSVIPGDPVLGAVAVLVFDRDEIRLIRRIAQPEKVQDAAQ